MGHAFDRLTPLGIGGTPTGPTGIPVSPTAPEPLSIDDVLPGTAPGKWTPETCCRPPVSITFSLTNSKSDAAQIIEYLAAFALQYGKSPCIVKAARCLVANITENNATAAQFSVIASFVLDGVVYQADPRGAEYVRSPVRLVKEYCKHGYTRGDCDDMALLAASLLNALGFQTRIIAVKLNGSEFYNHVLIQALVGGAWKWFDGCNKENPAKVWTDFIYHAL